jgi:DNA-binding response OmpR family regulator
MACNVLVVEDEIFVAAVIEDVVAEMGHKPIGIAADRSTALILGIKADIALVDLNLRDGPTGKGIGEALAENGVTVLYMTANPAQLGAGVPGTLGVLPKPVMDDELKDAVDFVVAQRQARYAPRPSRLTLFEPLQI